MRISDWSSDVCSSYLNARLGGAALGHGELLLRQGDAQHVHIGDAVEVERKPAPAAADVEHPLSRLETQLGGDMGFLVRLRLFKAGVPIGELGAARSEERRVGKESVSTCISRC